MGSGDGVDWLDLPDGTLLYLFERLLNTQDGRKSIESVSKVCKHWREAAFEIIMRDTAGSRPKEYVAIFPLPKPPPDVLHCMVCAWGMCECVCVCACVCLCA